jgi:hypothetical protein
MGVVGMKLVSNLIKIDYQQLADEDVSELREGIQNGVVYVLRGAIQVDLVSAIKGYLARIGQNSLPNYEPIVVGAPNSHRVNYWDERAFIKGGFHQFNFYPWNQDVFNMHKKFRKIYELRNQINGLPKERFLDWNESSECVPRLSFQFYPKSVGGLNLHSDPVDEHQLCVPILVMSKIGEEFQTGGLYLLDESKDKVLVDHEVQIGDVILFNAETPHGVETIDKGAEEDWVSFIGRWMMLFAINKVQGNTSISDAKEMEESK